jgi:ABC-type nitrate/sulfonate/bicarbonate transport system ATPase subunit
MHQRDLLLPWRKALDNAAIALQIQGTPRSAARERAASQFGEFGLTGFEDKYPAQLSGGMRQRVAFVRTMLGGQPLILLDEPFGSLDALTRTSAQDWLAAGLARDRRTTLLVTHDVDEGIFLADRVLVMSSRPGHIDHEEEIGLPRPRSRAFLLSEVFASHRRDLMARLGIVDVGATTT